jgi:hypothetical protein
VIVPARTATANSAIINSPDISNPVDHCQRPRLDDDFAVLDPSGSGFELNLSVFRFVAPIETEPVESWFLFMAVLHIKLVWTHRSLYFDAYFHPIVLHIIALGNENPGIVPVDLTGPSLDSIEREGNSRAKSSPFLISL